MSVQFCNPILLGEQKGKKRTNYNYSGKAVNEKSYTLKENSKSNISKANSAIAANNLIATKGANNIKNKCKSIKYVARNYNDTNKSENVQPKLIKIKSDDNYLNELLRKENVFIQSEKCAEVKIKKNKNVSSSSSYSTKNSSEDDIHTSDIIEQYKKRKKKELETKRKKIIRDKKNKLIKKKTYKDVETQVFLNEFTKYYENVKPQIEKIVEDVLNKALKEMYEEQELQKIKSEVDYYENIRQMKYQNLQTYEKNSEAFYEETQQKIKDRVALKNKVEIIMKKKIANSKAQKNMHYIFQKNLDLHSVLNCVPNNFEKNINLIFLPWLTDLILYLVNVKKEIAHYIITEIIEQTVNSLSELAENNKG
ncbi:conserved Plasmodium protein, unknown function [Plasmodium malariae]|uniref:Uncharacterized protein n=1 Tax=Plasmodium malariae TaxID=5858 RepID=A0A1D3TDF8_PLAMA|nr:conserved Plasmodium protein, unknown function [Plasmodium malariae]SCP02906.1 conserved Plasmodium protein, unknown function [Plasmodium malariae]